MKKLLFIIALFGIIKANAQDWSLTGNAATDTSVNFIGTTDNKGIMFRTNNQRRMILSNTGKLGVGTTTPQNEIDILSTGAARLGIKATGGTGAFIFMDKFLITDNATVSYRTGGISQWQSGTFANNDYAINNIPLSAKALIIKVSNNYVGIGTTAPATPLDVNGIITATGGNSANWNTAFGWGNHASAGYLTSETDPQVGSNTANYVPRWSGTSLSTGSIYDNATSVGIGTTTVADSKFSVQQSGTTLSTTKFLNTSKGPNISWIHFGITGDWYIRSASNAGKIILQDQAAGNVGIGTSAPLSKTRLHVVSDSLHAAYFTSNNNDSAASIIYALYNGGSPAGSFASGIETNVGFGTTSGIGGVFRGGLASVIGRASTPSGNFVFGGDFDAKGPVQYSYGVIGSSSGSGAPFGEKRGVYGFASGGVTNWSFYGTGDAFLSGGTWQTSDERLKRNIHRVENASLLLSKLPSREYYFRTDEYAYMTLPNEKQFGFLAQDMEKVFPNLVKEISHSTNPEDRKCTEYFKFKGVNYVGLIPVITEAVNEHSGAIEELKSEVGSLMSENEKLIQRIEKLESIISNNYSSLQHTVISPPFLKQNRPNPFSHSTMFEYFVPATIKSAALLITDISGKQIRNIELHGRVNSSVEIDMSNFSSGIYQVALIADGNKVGIVKMEVAE